MIGKLIIEVIILMQEHEGNVFASYRAPKRPRYSHEDIQNIRAIYNKAGIIAFSDKITTVQCQSFKQSRLKYRKIMRSR